MIINSNKNKADKKERVCAFWHWRRSVSLVILMTFSSSLFSPVFASYESVDDEINKNDNSRSHVSSSLRKSGSDSSASFPRKRKSSLEKSKDNQKVHQPKSKLFLSKNRYQPYFEIGGVKYFNQKSNVAGIYDLFIPLLQTDDQLFFTNLRIFDRSGSSFEGNFHLGFRKLYLDKKQMLGVYASFDRKRIDHKNWFNQIMVGAEYWHDKWFVGGNVYKPIGKSKKLTKREGSIDKRTGKVVPIADHYEQALPGFDAELGYSFTDNFTGYAGGYYFHEKNAETIAGSKLRLTYNYNQPHGRILGVLDGIGIEVGAQHDRSRGSSAYVGIKLKVGLTNLDKNSNLAGFQRHMTELVRRDPNIVIGKAKDNFYQPGAKGFQSEEDGREKKKFSDWSSEELLQELGLSATATLEEIEKRYNQVKKKYKKESLRFHPDRETGTHAAQVKLNLACERITGMYNELKKRFGVPHQEKDDGFRKNHPYSWWFDEQNKHSQQSAVDLSRHPKTINIDVQLKEDPQASKVKHFELSKPLFEMSVYKNVSLPVIQYSGFQQNKSFWQAVGGLIFTPFIWIDNIIDYGVAMLNPIKGVHALEIAKPKDVEQEDGYLTVKEEIAVWLNATTLAEKLDISRSLSNRISKETAQELVPFFKSHLSSQNSKLLKIAKSAFIELGKYQQLIWNKDEQELLSLVEDIDSWWSWWAKYVAKKFFELKVFGASFLLTSKQEESLQEEFKSNPWLKNYIRRIKFIEIGEVNRFLLFVKKNSLREEEIGQVFDRYLWGIGIARFYQKLLNGLVGNIQIGSGLQERDRQTLKMSVERLVNELSWPADFLFSLLRRAKQTDLLDLISVLDLLVDYEIDSEVVDRFGSSAIEILAGQEAQQLLVQITRLIRDYRVFVSKDVESFLDELAESNPDNTLVESLVEDFPDILAKIKEIKNDWLRYKYEIVISDVELDFHEEGRIYLFKREQSIGDDVEEDELKSTAICFTASSKTACLSQSDLGPEEFAKLIVALDAKDYPFIYKQAAKLNVAPKLLGISKSLIEWEKDDFAKWRESLANVHDDNIAEVIAVLSQAARNTIFASQKSYPRDVQILALLSLLRSINGGLAQISTGEGKSIIIAMFAAIKAFEGRRVDVVTSSGILAKRDAINYRDFYRLLSISVGNNLDFSEDSIAKECYQKDVVYGDILSFSGDALWDITDNVKYGRGFDILIVDEVDNMFIDKNSMKVQLSKPIPGFEILSQLLVYIWGAAKSVRSMLYQEENKCYFKLQVSDKKQESQKKGPQVRFIEKDDEVFQLTEIGSSCLDIMDEHIVNYTMVNLFAFDRAKEKRWFVVPAGKNQFVESQLSNWLRSIHLAEDIYREGVEYIIDKDFRRGGSVGAIIPIDVQTGEIQQNLRWSDGLHQILQIDNSLIVYPESVISVFISYFGFFNKYKGRIYGVTGTLGSKVHRKFLNRVYGVDTVVMPTFAQEDSKEFESIIVTTNEEWLHSLIDSIYKKVLRRKRSCLVIMETIEQVRVLYDRLVLLNDPDMRIFTYGVGTSDPAEFNVERKLKPGMVVVATNLAGRGTDFGVSNEVIKNGGLHVIVAMFSESVRVKNQAYGRTARKGEPGSVQLIINLEHIKTDNNNIRNIGDLEKYRDETEKQRLANTLEKSLPQLEVLDRLFNSYAGLVREFDTPTGYRLLIGRPEDIGEIDPFSFYLYQEDKKVMLEVIRDRGEEVKYLDITELISIIDQHVKKHFEMVLSDPGNAATSLSKQDYEAVSFIAAHKGYTRNPEFYNQVKNLFDKEVLERKEFAGKWAWIQKIIDRDKANDDKRRCNLKLLLKKDDRFKDLQNEDSEPSDLLLKKVELRSLFLFWLDQRKVHNKEYEISQLAENWGIWLRSRSEPLVQYAYREMLDEGRSLEQIKKQLFNEFQKFRQRMLDQKDQEGFIQNPAYLVLKAWRYLNIDLNSAIGFLDIAIELDKTYAWQGLNARANMKLLRDGVGIREKTEDDLKRANAVIESYYQDTMAAIDNIERVKIPGFESQLSFLSVHGVADYRSDLYVQLIIGIEIYREVLARLRKNIDVLIKVSKSEGSEMIRMKDVVDLEKATNEIDFAAAVLREKDKREGMAAVGRESLRNVASDLKNVDFSTSRDLIVGQIASSGGVIIEVESYKLEEPEKNWLGTVFSAVMGVAFICIGVALSLATAGMGSVFWGVIATSLVGKGIGDIASSVVSSIKGQPIDFNNYLKSTAISLGVIVATAGMLSFIDSVAGGMMVLDGIAGRASDAMGQTINPLANNPLLHIGKSAARQAAVTAASMGMSALGKKTVDRDAVKTRATDAVNEIISSYKGHLRKIFATDEYNGGSKLSDLLNKKIGSIVNGYLGRFQGVGATTGIGLTASTIGYLAGDVGSFGVGGLLKSTVDTSLGLLKNMRAIPDIASDVRSAIEELGKNTLASGTMFEQMLAKEFKDDGKKLFSIVNSQGYITSNEINYQECDKLDGVDLDGIQFRNSLGLEFDYRKGIKDVCESVSRILRDGYEYRYDRFRNVFVDLTTSATTYIRENVVDTVSQGVSQQVVSPASDWLFDRIQEMLKKKNKDVQYKAVKNSYVKYKKRAGDFEQDQKKKERFKQEEQEIGKVLVDQIRKSSFKAGKKDAADKADIQVITIEKGMTLSQLAKTHGVSKERLIELNNIKNPDLIYAGQPLMIPVLGAGGVCPILESAPGFILDEIWENGLRNFDNLNCPGGICVDDGGDFYSAVEGRKSVISERMHNMYRRIAMEAANAVYADSKKDSEYEDYISLKNRGYILFDHDKKSNGFYGGAYKKEIGGGKSEVIISYRGVDPPNRKLLASLRDAGDALRIFFGMVPKQQKDALAFAKKVISNVGPDAKILFAGHSLGCVLCQRTAIATGKDAIVFDCPRVKGPYGSSKITFYNALPNVINYNVDNLRDKQNDNFEMITVYKKSDICLNCRLPGGLASQHEMKNFIDAYNLDGSLKPGYTELRTKYIPNVLELYEGVPGYHEQLRAKWSYQYKENRFDSDAVQWFPKQPVDLDFRKTFPTFRSYVNVFIKLRSTMYKKR